MKGSEEEQATFCFRVIEQSINIVLNLSQVKQVDIDHIISTFHPQVYDLNNDGYISKEEILMWLRDALGSRGQRYGDGEDDLRDLVDVTLRYMDQDA